MAPLITTPAQRHLRNRLGLDKWLEQHDRRRFYFGWCEDLLRRMTELCGGEQPPLETVLLLLYESVKVDGTLADHCDKKSQDFWADEENWEKVWHATAAVIYHAYLVAVEQRRWPE